ncbi:Pentatricopeptide repeat-containing protein [Acorus calamus]|uniref:Pentatricopeptide repeat-containing protein n=1 Tax=Acorus calamus TaxID=4465 RepID=A0AAV9CM01_ACOCL|nr:Pentatricopeptide repeat-containing protein [Acorus calamus]
MAAIFHTDFLPHPFPSTPTKPNPRNPSRVRFSTQTNQTHTQSLDFNETHFTKLLNRSCKSGKYSESLYFLEYMVGKGHKPDVILCTKLIKGLFNSRNPDKAARVMCLLETHGVPDVFAYNAIIGGLCKTGRIEPAIRILDRMRRRGCAPDVVTYNMLIGSLCSRGELDLAMKVLDMLLGDDCAPSVITYTVLIEATIVKFGADEAMRLLDEMRVKGLKPDNYTYNMVLRGMCKEGLVDRAHEFVNCLDSPDAISYNTLLRGYLSRKRWGDGERLLEEMVSRGIEPTVSGNANHALEVFGKLGKSGGCSPNVSTYNALIGGLWNSGDKTKALELVSEMLEKGIDPDERWEGEQGDWVDEDMERSGFRPTSITYNTILLGLCKTHRIDMAINVFVEMVEKRCRTNETTYVLLVEGIAYAGHRTEAIELAEALVARGVVSDASFQRLYRTFAVIDSHEDVSSVNQ